MRLACWAVMWMGVTGGVAAGAEEYAVDPAASEVLVRVGKSGLFKFAGHAHEVTAPVSEGRIVADAADLARSSVVLRFHASALRVSGKDEPADDLPKVQEAMISAKVLDAARFGEIVFTSRKVTGRAAGASAYDLQVEGDLALHGATRALTVPVRVERAGDGTLEVRGKTTLRQTDFGMKPVSVAGVVNVKDELEVEFRLKTRPPGQP
jgi:polyisoprenoid-binding protein YceI